ncbi:unnamed protein product, partial [Symbiodinium sp. CCMP2456]
DPLNGSFVAAFADPLLINKQRATTSDSDPLNLCRARREDENAQCICKLSGERPLSVLGRMVAKLPHSGKSLALQLFMERCPEGVPDFLAGTLVLSCLLVIAVTTWMLWLAWASSQLEPLEPEQQVKGLVKVKTPMQTFVSGISWAAGFLLSLAAMQTGALTVVRKSCEQEVGVWLVAACPTALALVAALRLMNLLARKQLVHGSLSVGLVVTDLPEDRGIDAFLVCAVMVYFFYILYLVSTDFPTLLVALTALGGSAWTVLKTVSTARDMEQSLETVEVRSVPFAQSLDRDKNRFMLFMMMLVPFRQADSKSRPGILEPWQ